jgi:hypothetical protein
MNHELHAAHPIDFLKWGFPMGSRLADWVESVKNAVAASESPKLM